MGKVIRTHELVNGTLSPGPKYFPIPDFELARTVFVQVRASIDPDADVTGAETDIMLGYAAISNEMIWALPPADAPPTERVHLDEFDLNEMKTVPLMVDFVVREPVIPTAWLVIGQGFNHDLSVHAVAYVTL